jgi:uncharacterized protein YtpQ (UPF0354 family)
MTIINDDSRVVTKLETSHTDDARVVIYDCHIFIVHATGLSIDISVLTWMESKDIQRKNRWHIESIYYLICHLIVKCDLNTACQERQRKIVSYCRTEWKDKNKALIQLLRSPHSKNPNIWYALYVSLSMCVYYDLST